MSAKSKVNLATNLAATGLETPLVVGGNYWFIAEATFGGGTVKLQFKTPQGTWIDVTSGSLTAAGYIALLLVPGLYRANIATATAVFADLVPAS